jgi:hypothetical protein
MPVCPALISIKMCGGVILNWTKQVRREIAELHNTGSISAQPAFFSSFLSGLCMPQGVESGDRSSKNDDQYKG